MSSGTPLYQNLDTEFVNLWSLLRKLTQQGFVGRVHVELPEYSADVFLDGSSTPLVREIDRAANTETIEQGLLHRVVLRARETPGVINVFAGGDEASTQTPAVVTSEDQTNFDSSRASDSDSLPEAPAAMSEAVSNPVTHEQTATPIAVNEDVYRSGSYEDWPAILVASGELIGAVERGVNAAGGNFAALFGEVRLELADDYIFLDPFAQTLHYAEGVVSLKTQPAVGVFVAGLSEALRRTVNLVAFGDRERRVRERVALEILPVARRRTDTLERAGMRTQLDRIAGTIVM
jgi:hypothetical protein